nr:uncharacterized protein LOC113700585 [Coffea arabica]
MVSLHNVKRIGAEFYGLEHLDSARSSSREAKPINLFPKLSRFVLEDMDSLEEWSNAMVPSNSSSSIKVFPNLQYLAIERLPSLAVLPDMENLTSLEELEIRRCGIVAYMKNPQSLHTLNISRCDKLNTSLSNNLEKFTLLERLTIFSDDPGCWAKGLQYLANLCELELGGFSDNLDYFPWPDSITKNDGDSAKQHFFSLEKLELFGWPKITSLPDQFSITLP